MLRYIAGILTAFLFFGSVFGLLYILDQYNYIDLKPSVLLALSRIPGWEDVAEAYKLGADKQKVLQEREAELAAKAEEIAAEAKKLEEEKQALIEQVVALEEKEEYLSVKESKLAKQQQTTPSSSRLTGKTNSERYATAARLMEAMKPEVAGENLLKMPFEMGVSVLSLLDSRKAGKILETLPPEESAKYMAELAGE
ncbi:MAG TPA: hypothetical protein VIL83_00380 [Capillibacterium sp.]